MQIIRNKSMAATGLVAVLVVLFSFSSAPSGGDKFEIYLNNKLVVEQYVYAKNAPQYLTLYRGNYNGSISVYYSHCGKLGTGRSIVVKDEQDRTIKEWQFGDDSDKLMTWEAKELMDLQTSDARSSLRLYYYSKEMPQGKLLATIVKGSTSRES